MALLAHAFRFMRVVPPLPALMVSAWTVVTLAGGVALVAGGVRGRDAIAPVLVLQVFAVSTGFATYARRGHYDLLLAGGVGRVRTAAAQWIAAALPGVGSWLLLAACETLVSGGVPDALTAGTTTAMLVVSTLPWALTVGLPRFSGAIGWMVAGALVTSLAPGLAAGQSHAPGVAGSVAHAAGHVLYPLRLSARGYALDPGEALLPLSVALLSMVAAFTWIARRDVPLESGQ